MRELCIKIFLDKDPLEKGKGDIYIRDANKVEDDDDDKDNKDDDDDDKDNDDREEATLAKEEIAKESNVE